MAHSASLLPHVRSIDDAMAQEGISWSPLDVSWTPVLAVGSNAGVSQLCRKYPSSLFPNGVVIPVSSTPSCTQGHKWITFSIAQWM